MVVIASEFTSTLRSKESGCSKTPVKQLKRVHYVSSSKILLVYDCLRDNQKGRVWRLLLGSEQRLIVVVVIEKEEITCHKQM